MLKIGMLAAASVALAASSSAQAAGASADRTCELALMVAKHASDMFGGQGRLVAEPPRVLLLPEHTYDDGWTGPIPPLALRDELPSALGTSALSCPNARHLAGSDVMETADTQLISVSRPVLDQGGTQALVFTSTRTKWAGHNAIVFWAKDKGTWKVRSIRLGAIS